MMVEKLFNHTVAQVIYDAKFKNKIENCVQKSKDFETCLRSILAVIAVEVKPVLDLMDSQYIQYFDLWNAAIIEPVLKFIAESDGRYDIFSLINIKQFQSRYTQCQRFCSQLMSIALEDLNGRGIATASFQSSSQQAVDQLLDKFSVGVYFQMVFKQVAFELEKSLPSISDVIGGFAEDGSKHQTEIPQFINAAQTLVRQIWDNQQFCIDVLTPKLWRFTLQIVIRVQRHVKYLSDGLRQSTNNGNVDEGGKDAASNLPALPQRANDDPLGRGAVPRQKVWSICFYLIHGYSRFVKELNQVFQSHIQQFIPADALEDVQEQLNTQVQKFNLQQDSDNVLSQLQQMLTQSLSQSGVEVLKQVKTIPAQYRRTGRDVPKQASYFIKNQSGESTILAQLNTYLKAANNVRIQLHSDDTFHAETVCNNVVIDVASSYRQLLEDLLTNLKYVEDSLKKLQSSSARVSSVGGPGGKVSDEDKIRTQLFIDVHAFVDDCHLLYKTFDHSESQSVTEQLSSLSKTVEQGNQAPINSDK
ncbi:hypothetical protein MIR68_001529 [Amoeboaphelidium protococcarum]|nr:hypothetical protein MIR68_001529 [Amoeboaphelidium protococcarum]